MSLAVATHTGRAGVAAIPLDEDGFLSDHRLWNRDLAQQLADHSGIGDLGSSQWLLIDYVRDKYFRLGAMPPMRHMCRKLGVDRDAVKKLFGSCLCMWQVAGLPNPGAEAISYMS